MAVATTFTAVMTALTGNTGGGVESLPRVTVNGARKRVSIAQIVLASQASGSVIGLARIPVGAVITDMTWITDTSLGSATIAIGDANSGALYAAAQTFTATQTPTPMGLVATRGVPITTGYDCVTGAANSSYEDLTLTVGTAALPASGNLTGVIEWAID